MVHRIRIAYVHSSLCFGGTEAVRLALLRRLDSRRFDPHVICFEKTNQAGEQAFRRELDLLGMPVHDLQGTSRYWDARLFWRLYRLLQKLDAHIVQTAEFDANTVGRVVARWLGTPLVIAEEHNIYLWKRWYHRWLDHWLVSWTDVVLCCSEAVRKASCKGSAKDSGKSLVLHNPLDVDRFAPTRREALRLRVRREMNIGPSQIVIGIVGNIRPQKGPEFAIE